MIRYEIKIYNGFDLSIPKKTITFIAGNKEAIKLKTDFTFDGNMNGGQGAMRLSFNTDFKDQTYQLSDIVKIRGYDDMNKNGRTIYTGYVDNIERIIDESGETIELTLFGLASLMETILAISLPSGQYNISNQDPSIAITNLLNFFNSQFINPLITFDPIPLFGSPISVFGKDETVLSMLRKIHEITGWIFYVDGNGEFSTQPRGTIPDHQFTVRKDINAIKRLTGREDIITRLFMEVDNQLVPAPFQVPNTYQYDNLPAQAIHGIIDEFTSQLGFITTTGLPTASMDLFAQTFLDERANPKNFLRLELNNRADFLTIKPGDLVRIKNLDFTLDDAIINKIAYTSTTLSVDCEKTIDYGKELLS